MHVGKIDDLVWWRSDHKKTSKSLPFLYHWICLIVTIVAMRLLTSQTVSVRFSASYTVAMRLSASQTLCNDYRFEFVSALLQILYRLYSVWRWYKNAQEWAKLNIQFTGDKHLVGESNDVTVAQPQRSGFMFICFRFLFFILSWFFFFNFCGVVVDLFKKTIILQRQGSFKGMYT